MSRLCEISLHSEGILYDQNNTIFPLDVNEVHENHRANKTVDQFVSTCHVIKCRNQPTSEAKKNKIPFKTDEINFHVTDFRLKIF